MSLNDDKSGGNEESSLLARDISLHMTLTTRIVIFTVAFLNIFAQYMFFTVPLPFLANEVIMKRQMSSTVAGVCFAALCLALSGTLISAPKTSPYLTKRRAVVLNILLILPSTPFYFLELDNTSFVIYTIVSRSLQGIAIGLSDVRFLDMMTIAFSNKMSLVTSMYEVSFSFCLMIGPVIGGFLYEKFGFGVPVNLCMVMVVIFSTAGVICTYYIPRLYEASESSHPCLSDILYFPIILLGVTVMGVVSIAATVVETYYSNFMWVQFHKTEAASGVVMTISGLFYTLATLISGVIGAKQQNLKYLILVGLLIMSLSAVLMGLEEGPAETLGHYWPAAMYSALEIGSGLTQVAVLPLIVLHYKNRVDYPENIAASHMGGVYCSSFFFGSFLGPIIGGGILKFTNYQHCFEMSGVLVALALFLVLLFFFKNRTLLAPWTQYSLKRGSVSE